MKYLLITLAVQDGERRHDHRLLHTTNAQSIEFAAQRYAASFWGFGKRYNKEDDFWWVNGEITIRLSNVIELSLYEYQLMNRLFGGYKETKPYFEIVQAGHCEARNGEEIHIHCGENGNLFLYQDEDKLGFIVDVYGQDNFVDSMTVWEEDLEPKEIKVPTGLVNAKGDELFEGNKLVLGKPEVVQEFMNNFNKAVYKTIEIPDEIVRGIIERKESGQDCTEEESAEIKG